MKVGTDPFYAHRDHIKLQVSRFPMPYLSATWDDVPAAAADAVDAAQEWLDGWSRYGRPEKGLLLAGPPGRGKTLIATLCLREVMFTHLQRGAFISAANYISRSMLALTPGRLSDDELNFMQDITEDGYVKCLVLDDVSKEHKGASGWAVSEIERMIRNRYMSASCTIITSNLSKAEWDSMYTESLASFMHQGFVRVPVIGPDARKQ